MTHCLLVDGSGILYRSYFGLPELSGMGGDVRVIFGFAKVMLTLLKQGPSKIAIAWDEKGKTIRHTEFVDYKATREAMPDDMARQIPLTKQLVSDLGIPAYSQPGYEADDVLATWVEAMKDSHTMSIISSDKDLKQLINPVVRRQDPFRNNHYTHQEFLNEYGFDPQYFGEYLTLLGDVSDNIPGVAGIGPKTAIGLIQQYQTIESIYVHLDDISPKIATKLRDNEKNARLSHELIRLRCVPDQNTSIPDIRERFDPVVWHRVLIEQYGFPSLAKLVAEVTKEYQSPKAVSLFG